VGKGIFTKSGKIKIPSYQFSLIIGLLLSGLTIASATNKNARLGFKQSLVKGI